MPPIIRKTESGVSLAETRRSVLNTVSWQIRSTGWSPPTDFYESEDAFIVRVEIAGMREQDFEVSVQHDYLVISGSRPDLPERRAYHQMEIRFGKFSTTIGLPGPVDVEQSTAVYEDGFLLVTLPKARPNKIRVEG